jgi:HD-like signal output (HDOD) protein
MAPLSKEQIIKKLDELPTLPAVVYELNRLINDPMSSTGDVEKVMSNDQTLTAKVLKLVNSAYYAIPGGVTNLKKAITHLGFDTVQQLVLGASILNALSIKESSVPFDLTKFWQHSIGVGIAGETIAKRLGYKVPADVLTCGLVHDMGKIALLIIAPDQFKAVLDKAQESSITIIESEKQLNYPGHAEIGYALANKWLLPQQIQNSICFHHQNDASKRGKASPELNQVIDMVLLSNLLIHAIKFGNGGHSIIAPAPKQVLDRLNLSPSGLPPLVASIKNALSRADAFISIIANKE